MRAAAIAAVVFAAFIGVMYLRFSGDAVPSPASRGSSAGECLIARPDPPPDSTPTPVGGEPSRVPCTLSTPRTPSDPLAGLQPVPTGPNPEPEIPEILKGMSIFALKLGPEIEFPAGVSFIVETGCTQCDGSTTGFSRVYRDPTGAIRTETLFSIEKLGIGPRIIQTDKGPLEEPPLITGFGVAPDASEMIVAICTQGICPVLGPAGEGAVTVLFLSRDGGITWQSLAELANGVWIVGRVASGKVLLSFDGSAYQLFPSGTPVNPPNSDALWAGVLNTGEIVWHTQDGRLLRADGGEYFPRNMAGGNTSYLGEPVLSSETGRGLATLNVSSAGGAPLFYLVDMAVDRQINGIFSTDAAVHPGVWLDESGLYGNATIEPVHLLSALPTPPSVTSPFFVDYLPVFIELGSHRIHPIAGPFLQPPLYNGRNRIVAVQQGPFTRVVNTEGTCLNIRAEPGGGAILDCAAEGVLLRNLLQTVDAGGVAWLRVATPAGLEGWASTQYLER